MRVLAVPWPSLTLGLIWAGSSWFDSVWEAQASASPGGEAPAKGDQCDPHAMSQGIMCSSDRLENKIGVQAQMQTWKQVSKTTWQLIQPLCCARCACMLPSHPSQPLPVNCDLLSYTQPLSFQLCCPTLMWAATTSASTGKPLGISMHPGAARACLARTLHSKSPPPPLRARFCLTATHHLFLGEQGYVW